MKSQDLGTAQLVEFDTMLVAPLVGQQIAGTDFVIAEWTDDGCPPEGPLPIAPLHLHHDDDEAWYVLEGRLVVRVGDDEIGVPAGGCVLVPRGTPHTYWNPDPRPVRYLLLMTPRVQGLIEAIHAADDRSFEAMRRLFAAHGSALLA